MSYIILSYTNRENTLKLKKYLSGYKIFAQVINTPQDAHIGCGLSVKINSQDKFKAMQAAARHGLGNYIMFAVDTNGFSRKIVRIN